MIGLNPGKQIDKSQAPIKQAKQKSSNIMKRERVFHPIKSLKLNQNPENSVINEKIVIFMMHEHVSLSPS